MLRPSLQLGHIPAKLCDALALRGTQGFVPHMAYAHRYSG